jgi:hypothetical protein
MSAFNVGDKIIFDPKTDWHPTWQVGAQGKVTEITPHESTWGYDYQINLFGPDGQESGPFPAHAKELTAVVKHYFEVGEQFRYDRAYAAIPQDTVYTVKEIRSGQAVVSYAGGGEAYFSDNPDCKSHTIPVPPKSVHTFSVGDRLVYTPYVEGITYEITSLAEGNERYGVRWTTSSGVLRTERAEYLRPQDYKVVEPERAPGGFARGERVRLRYQKTRYDRDVHIILDEPHDDAEGWHWTLAPDSPQTLRYGAKTGWDRIDEFERLEPVVTHRFKVGDVIAGQQGSGTHYTVLGLKNVPDTYSVTWPMGYPTVWDVSNRADVVLVRHEDQKPKANLGLASTQELLDEIAARLAANENNGGN